MERSNGSIFLNNVILTPRKINLAGHFILSPYRPAKQITFFCALVAKVVASQSKDLLIHSIILHPLQTLRHKKTDKALP